MKRTYNISLLKQKQKQLKRQYECEKAKAQEN